MGHNSVTVGGDVQIEIDNGFVAIKRELDWTGDEFTIEFRGGEAHVTNNGETIHVGSIASLMRLIREHGSE